MFHELPLSTRRTRAKISAAPDTAQDDVDDSPWNHGKNIIIIGPQAAHTFSPRIIKNEVMASNSPTKFQVDLPSKSAGESATEGKQPTREQPESDPELSPPPSLKGPNPERPRPPPKLAAASSPTSSRPTPNAAVVKNIKASPQSDVATVAAATTSAPGIDVESGSVADEHPPTPTKAMRTPSETNLRGLVKTVTIDESATPVDPSDIAEQVSSTSQTVTKPVRSVSFASTVQVRPMPNRKPPTILLPLTHIVITPPEQSDYFQPLARTKVTTYSRKRSRSAPVTKSRKPPAKKKKTSANRQKSRPQEPESDQDDDPIENDEIIEVDDPAHGWSTIASIVAPQIKAIAPTLSPLEGDAVVGLLFLSQCPVVKSVDSSSFTRPPTQTKLSATNFAAPQHTALETQAHGKGKGKAVDLQQVNVNHAVDRQQVNVNHAVSIGGTSVPAGSTTSTQISKSQSLLNVDLCTKPTLFEKYAYRPATLIKRVSSACLGSEPAADHQTEYALSPDSDE